MPTTPTMYDIVTQTFAQAQAAASEYSETAQDNLAAAAAVLGTTPPSVAPANYTFTPAVVEPNVTIPMDAVAAGFEAFEEIWDKTIADLVGYFESFITEYFPDETGYINEAQTWLSNSITAGGTGIAPSVEAQIWERERARVLRDASRAKGEVIDSWASRGFPLPPGALVGATALINKDAQDKIAESSSKVAIAQAELEQKNVLFAVENAIKLWTGAMGAASDYIKAISVGPNSAGVIVPSVTDSQSKLISAANTYYQSRIAVQELLLKSGQIPAQWYQDANLKNGDLKMDFVKAQVAAASEGARIAGTVAAGALNALHTSTGIDFGQKLSFNYQGDTPEGIPQ